jgi:hypothetical protein
MISQGQCNIFKKNCLSGLENFAAGTSYVYKIALYTSLADLTPDTVAYSTTGEIIGTGYTAGGKILTVSQIPTYDASNDTAFVSFSNVTWNPASFTTRAALIYNSTTGAAVAVLDFGSDKTNTAAGTFTVTFPAATATTSILRIS